MSTDTSPISIPSTDVSTDISTDTRYYPSIYQLIPDTID